MEPSSKVRIATFARALQVSAPTHELREFYRAVAEEFQRQVDFDAKRAEANAKLAGNLDAPVLPRTTTRDEERNNSALNDELSGIPGKPL